MYINLWATIGGLNIMSIINYKNAISYNNKKKIKKQINKSRLK